MGEGEVTIMATDGGLEYRIGYLKTGPEQTTRMGVGWAVGIGQREGIRAGKGEVRWLAKGHGQTPTPWGGGASSYVAEVVAVVAGLRALQSAQGTQPERHLEISVCTVSDSQSATRSLPQRILGDTRRARESPVRCWLPELRRSLEKWRTDGQSFSFT